MLRIRMLSLGLSISAFTLGCSRSDFTSASNIGGSKKTTKQVDSSPLDPLADLDSNSGPKDNQFDDGTDDSNDSGGFDSHDDNSAGGSTDEEDSGGSEDPEKKILTEEGDIIAYRNNCWFAVSGTWVGGQGYNNTFPAPFDGGPIKHGASFDSVGGVFLEARAEPYVYGKGAKEIDMAVESTFDAFIIPKGMRATIKDGSNNIIFTGDGPTVAGSSYYGSASYKKQLATNTRLPNWIEDIAAADQIKSIPLYSVSRFGPPTLDAAQTVLVEPIPNEECDVIIKP